VFVKLQQFIFGSTFLFGHSVEICLLFMHVQRRGFMATGNPCPICRDEYLVLHPKVSTVVGKLQPVSHIWPIIAFYLSLDSFLKLYTANGL